MLVTPHYLLPSFDFLSIERWMIDMANHYGPLGDRWTFQSSTTLTMSHHCVRTCQLTRHGNPLSDRRSRWDSHMCTDKSGSESRGVWVNHNWQIKASLCECESNSVSKTLVWNWLWRRIWKKITLTDWFWMWECCVAQQLAKPSRNYLLTNTELQLLID